MTQLANGLHLGKADATYDRRDLRFADFQEHRTTALATAKVGFAVDRVAKISWSMLGNGPSDDDSLPPDWTAARRGAGDCVWADAVNRVKYANALAGRAVEVNAKCAIDGYAAVTGYDPVTGANDNGTDMRNALNYARRTGILDAAGHRHKIGGYCALTAGDWTELLEALAIFDVVSIGIQFPTSAMDQFDAGKPWSYVKASPIEGGHDVLVTTRPTYTRVGVQTWARTQPMQSSFYRHLCDEAYGIFLPESLDASGRSPEGFDLAAFRAALAEL